MICGIRWRQTMDGLLRPRIDEWGLCSRMLACDSLCVAWVSHARALQDLFVRFSGLLLLAVALFGVAFCSAVDTHVGLSAWAGSIEPSSGGEDVQVNTSKAIAIHVIRTFSPMGDPSYSGPTT